MKAIILFNAFQPRPGRRGETVSESGQETIARQAGEALASGGYRVRLLKVRSDVNDVVASIRRERPGVVVNLCEAFRGNPGFEAQVAGLLELLGVPFTGNGSAALSQCRDKFRTKLILSAYGVPTPPGWLVEDGRILLKGAEFPLIVKPNNEDAGIGIYPSSVVRTRRELKRQTERVLKAYAQPALVESFIEGREISASVVGHHVARVLPLSEILFRNYPAGLPRIVGYDAKWRVAHRAYSGTVPSCPARVPSVLRRGIEDAALRAWHALGLRGYARVDFRVNGRGKFFVLEVNPNPDASRDAGLARSLEAAGMAYEDFWVQQAGLAQKKGTEFA